MAGTGGAKKKGIKGACEICHHFHKYEVGEICRFCGHHLPVVSDQPPVQVSGYSSEILPEFLFLGDYNDASKIELLKTQRISRILNTTVKSCENLYLKKFTYYSLEDGKYPFYNAIKFLERCERDKARVLVHCVTGTSRSAAFVIAYLMKNKNYNLKESYQWVKQRRPSIDIQQDAYEHLLLYQKKIFASRNKMLPPTDAPTISSPKDEDVQSPTLFIIGSSESIFDSFLSNWDFLPSTDPMFDMPTPPLRHSN